MHLTRGIMLPSGIKGAAMIRPNAERTIPREFGSTIHRDYETRDTLMASSSTESSDSGRLVVLLGASNLSLSLSRASRLLAQLPGPLDIRAACGFGRSYGMQSRCVATVFPGITQSALWSELPTTVERRPLSLLTDIGNDLMYGVDVKTILEWVESCLRQLADRQSEIVITLPPLARIRQLKPWQFAIAQRLLFPLAKWQFPVMLKLVESLSEELQDLADQYGASLVEPSHSWYGLDPIHIRLAERETAFDTFFSHWTAWEQRRAIENSSFTKPKRIRPEKCWRWGRLVVTPQPVFQSENLKLSVY